jgi:hypothetical protein|uniref:PD-(D/E)XK nuclease family protein n=1 Tax=Candidatus Aramenus sulfurataquae TaxID=1326980 RepID=A0A0F2LL84_9CREN|nr:PD-(D/E)XK nuclease family protein [Candidatus Aramenus sulfurataquae]
MKLYDILRSEFTNHENVIRGENEVFVTDLVTCPVKREFYEIRGADSALIHGVAVHNAVESVLVKYGCEPEVSVFLQVPERGVLIRGRVDLLCPGNHVVEIKTSSKVNLEHVVQLFIYKYILNASRASLVYLSTSTLAVYDLVGNKLCNEVTGSCEDLPITLNYDLILSLVDHYLKGLRTPQFSQCSSCFFRSQCPLLLPS